jgi:hypothetical protein
MAKLISEAGPLQNILNIFKERMYNVFESIAIRYSLFSLYWNQNGQTYQ